MIVLKTGFKKGEKVSEIKTVGVIGAGVMGGGIAQSLAQAGYRVICTDIASEALETAREDAAQGRFGLAGAVARGKLAAEEADAARDRITWSDSFEQAADSDLVIECVPEKLDVKMAVFRSLDEAAPEHTILASNTSGFSIAAMAGATRRPSRVIGWHWASPAFVMKFAEIVVTEATDEAVRDQVMACATKCGKNPVAVSDNPLEWGFVANRIYFAMLREASRVVDEGVATHAEVNETDGGLLSLASGPFCHGEGCGQRLEVGGGEVKTRQPPISLDPIGTRGGLRMEFGRSPIFLNYFPAWSLGGISVQGDEYECSRSI